MHKKAFVHFHFLVPCTLPNRKVLKKFIVSLFKKERKALEELTVVFCSDNYVLELNRQFLHHDSYTDILSFPLSGIKEPLIAEIYISVDRVRDNARLVGTTFQEELHRVIFHGILHFCGYKDKSGSDIIKVRAAEDKYLRAYFYTN